MRPMTRWFMLVVVWYTTMVPMLVRRQQLYKHGRWYCTTLPYTVYKVSANNEVKQNLTDYYY